VVVSSVPTFVIAFYFLAPISFADPIVNELSVLGGGCIVDGGPINPVFCSSANATVVVVVVEQFLYGG